MLHRIYLPRTVFALSGVESGLVNLIPVLGPLALIMLATRIPLKPALVALPVAMLLTAVFTLEAGLFFSVLAARFANVVHVYQPERVEQ